MFFDLFGTFTNTLAVFYPFLLFFSKYGIISPYPTQDIGEKSYNINSMLTFFFGQALEKNTYLW